MGGFGSGRWYGRERRETVESSLYVSADDLSCRVPLTAHQRGEIHIRQPDGGIVASGPFVVLPVRGTVLVIRFRLRRGDEIVTHGIPISTTPARSGGSRLCFACPTGDLDNYCGRASRMLHLPPGRRLFGCRRCHRLAYASSQRRTERLARSDKAADELADEADVILGRIERGKSVKIDETLRCMRRMSYASHDLMELLREAASVGTESQ